MTETACLRPHPHDGVCSTDPRRMVSENERETRRQLAKVDYYLREGKSATHAERISLYRAIFGRQPRTTEIADEVF